MHKSAGPSGNSGLREEVQPQELQVGEVAAGVRSGSWSGRGSVALVGEEAPE